MGILGKLFQVDERERELSRREKELEKERARNLDIAECDAQLELCRQFFEDTIAEERVIALDRQSKRMSDAVQKERIHDAAVALLAVEEAQYDLRSITNASDFDAVLKRLGAVTGRMHRMDRHTEVSKKQLRQATGAEYEDTKDARNFSERAVLVNEFFVNDLIQGRSMAECLATRYPTDSDKRPSDVDFETMRPSDPPEASKAPEQIDFTAPAPEETVDFFAEDLKSAEDYLRGVQGRRY